MEANGSKLTGTVVLHNHTVSNSNIVLHNHMVSNSNVALHNHMVNSNVALHKKNNG